MLTEAGAPAVLQRIDLPVELPGPGRLRVRIRAADVGSTGLTVLTDHYSFAPTSDCARYSRFGDRSYASADPRIHSGGLIADSPLQVQNLEVDDERDAIVAVEAAGRYSSLVA